MDHPIDEERRRPIDAEIFARATGDPCDTVEHPLICERFRKALFGESSLLGNTQKFDRRVGCEGPVSLSAELGIDEIKVSFVTGASCERRGGQGQLIGRGFAHEISNLAGLDIA